MEEKLQRFMDMSELLMCELEKELTKASEGCYVNVTELGEVMDMLKDISEIKRNCYEAAYYEKHTNKSDDGKETDMMTVEDVKTLLHDMWKKANVDEKKTMKTMVSSLLSEMII